MKAVLTFCLKWTALAILVVLWGVVGLLLFLLGWPINKLGWLMTLPAIKFKDTLIEQAEKLKTVKT